MGTLYWKCSFELTYRAYLTTSVLDNVVKSSLIVTPKGKEIALGLEVVDPISSSADFRVARVHL